MENKMTNTMPERFDEMFPVNEDLSIAGQSTAIKDFIQSEIDLAVANREKEIIRVIWRMIDENSHIANYYDTAQEIISIITTK